MGVTRSAAIAAVAVLGVAASARAADGLTAAVYGGSWGDALQKCILDPFAAASGVKVTPEPGVSTVTLAKLRQQKGSPVIDVAWMDGGVSELAGADDLLAPLDTKTVPNIAGMIPEAVYHKPDGTIYALGTGFYAMGIVYSTKEVKTKPASWWDLWNADYAGAVTVPAPTNAMGIAFVARINSIAGGTLDNLEPGLQKLKALKVSSFFDSSGAADNSFQGGEAIIGAHYAQAGWALSDKGLPIGYAVPKEGAPGGDIRLHVVKDGKHLADALKLADYAVSQKASTCMSETIYVGPTAKDVALSDKAKQRLPWGADGSVKNLALADWVKLNDARSRIVEQFNREVVAK
jgi:putative spermidine/putrescine transport system substrate-binding protein